MFIYFRQLNVHSTHCSHKGLSRFCFLFFVFCFVVVVVFFLPERIKVLQPRLPRRTGLFPTQSSLSLSYFFGQWRWKCCTRHLPYRPNRHTGLFFFFSQVYLSHGTFVCIVISQLYFIQRSRLRSKYCTPYLPQRTTFHTVACLMITPALTSHGGENNPKHNRNFYRHESRGETNCIDQIK